jgi:pimeloyl-ACP methyl ester carboxylesterase
MPVASYNGVRFHVQELGKADGEPVVMLHGLLIGSLASWYFTVAPLLAQTRRVLLYDLRGHGLSERVATGYDLGTMRADLGAILDGFTRAPATLVGHSFGAAVALAYALAHPERVAKLVVVEAPLPPSHLEELDGFTRLAPERMVEALPGALKEVLGRRGRHAARLVDSLSFLTTRSSLLDDLRRAEDFDDRALGSLRCPVLCVYGTRSSCLPAGRRLARAIPGASLRIVEGGHFLPVEAPGALGEAIVSFLEGERAHG